MPRLEAPIAGPISAAPSAPRWWHEAVFYQIYPRSFADANGDGIGDLPGIIDRLDYLADLGIDAIWLSPHYPSPQKDVGYDIVDFLDVHPEYGTLDDFRRLIDGAHARGIRMVLDLVLNATSDEHPWFVESRSSRDNPKRDWYLWRDGRDGDPPNNWVSQFGGSAWTLDPRTDQYYHHNFLAEQPDLNWRNPEVVAAMWAAIRFWLDVGVDGFRLDAIGNLFKHAELPDHASSASIYDLRRRWLEATTDDSREAIGAALTELFGHQIDQPEVHGLMREIRRLVDAYPDRMLVGETDRVAFYGNGRDELDLVFDFPLMHGQARSPDWIARHLMERWKTMPAGAWPAITLNNHDDSRVRTRFARGGEDLASARVAATLILTLPGTPFLYNGEELGMTDLDLADIGQVQDPWALWFHGAALGEGGLTREEALGLTLRFARDRARSPMQWANLPNGGFSPAGTVPWLPVNPNHAAGVNADDERVDPGSMLRFYRRLLRLRRRSPALRRGDATIVAATPEVLAYVRRSEPDRDAALVVLNFSGRARRLSLDVGSDAVHTRLSTRRRPGHLEDPARLSIGPFEAYIGEID